ncbi:hypothetical protein DYU05_15350 [Mucilaginibacter terrenus]|uniref:Holin n=1 Tax=Mucilaginibacter terrenus TaxID=2482727 RepID=A0A3E2NLW6_9SPHI|nr:hypothetical protein [Mucilaginibacter terrenus]RFZ82004.1 hypothetical protein DYU05_15350 [Mucilaginibacter terrenus]
MKTLLTIFNNLQLSYTALFKFMVSNVWKMIVWTFCIYLAPTYELIGLTVFLLCADLITGIWKSLKTGVPVTAAKIGLSVEKMIAYTFGVVCTYAVQHGITNDAIKVMLFYSGIVSLKELKSIIENIEIITGTSIWGVLSKQIGNLMPGKKLDKEDKETKDETK